MQNYNIGDINFKINDSIASENTQPQLKDWQVGSGKEYKRMQFSQLEELDKNIASQFNVRVEAESDHERSKVSKFFNLDVNVNLNGKSVWLNKGSLCKRLKISNDELEKAIKTNSVEKLIETQVKFIRSTVVPSQIAINVLLKKAEVYDAQISDYTSQMNQPSQIEILAKINRQLFEKLLVQPQSMKKSINEHVWTTIPAFVSQQKNKPLVAGQSIHLSADKDHSAKEGDIILKVDERTNIVGFHYFSDQELIGKGGSSNIYRPVELVGKVKASIVLAIPSNPNQSQHAVAVVNDLLSDGPKEGLPPPLKAVNGGKIIEAPLAEGDCAHLKKKGVPLDGYKCVRQVCNALKWAFNKGYVHQDIKPSNILMNKDGNYFLHDWETATRHTVDEDTSNVTMTRTRGYFPKNFEEKLVALYKEKQEIDSRKGASQADKEAIAKKIEKYDRSADIYALGATIYEILTNKDIDAGLDLEVLKDLPRESAEVLKAMLLSDPDKQIEALEKHFGVPLDFTKVLDFWRELNPPKT